MKIFLAFVLVSLLSGCQKIESLITGKVYLACNGHGTTTVTKSLDFVDQFEFSIDKTSVVIDRHQMTINEPTFVNRLKKCKSVNEYSLNFDTTDCKGLSSILEDADVRESSASYNQVTKVLSLISRNGSSKGNLKETSAELACTEVDI